MQYQSIYHFLNLVSVPLLGISGHFLYHPGFANPKLEIKKHSFYDLSLFLPSTYISTWNILYSNIEVLFIGES